MVEMGAEYLKWVLLVLLAAQGGGNDLLDYADTAAFWQSEGVEMTVGALSRELRPPRIGDISGLIKQLGDADWQVRDAAHKKILAMGPGVLDQLEKAAKSDDPETSIRAKALMQGLRERVKGAAVRRLMAIRALGELKNKDALPVLKPLLDSKELFVAEYASRAIAQIEGKPFIRPRPPDARRLKDLELLPADSVIVFQLTLPNDAQMSFAKAFESGGKLLKGADVEALTKQVTRVVTRQAMRFGNIRLDAAAVGVATNEDGDDPTAAIVLLGKYDHERMGEVMKELQLKPAKIGRQAAFKLDEQVMLAFPSNDRMVVILEDEDSDKALRDVGNALKGQGAGGPMADPAMAPLLARVNMKSPLWMAVRLVGVMRGEGICDAFVADSVEKDGRLSVRLVLDGDTPESAQELLDDIRKTLNSALEEVERTHEEWRGLQAGEKLLKGMKDLNSQIEGKRITLTFEVEDGRRMLAAIPVGVVAVAAQFMNITPVEAEFKANIPELAVPEMVVPDVLP